MTIKLVNCLKYIDKHLGGYMSHKNKNQTVIDKIKPAIQNAIAYETTKQQVIKQLNKRKQYKERHEKIITTV